MTRIIMSLFVLVGLVTIGCSSAPKTEVRQANDAISAARGMKAEKYAKEDLQLAQQNYVKANELLQKDKNDEARAAALEAKKQAEVAYEKSISQYVKEESTNLDKNVSEAKAVHADKAAPDKFKQAEQTKEKLNQHLEQLKQKRQELKNLEQKLNKEVAES